MNDNIENNLSTSDLSQSVQFTSSAPVPSANVGDAPKKRGRPRKADVAAPQEPSIPTDPAPMPAPTPISTLKSDTVAPQAEDAIPLFMPSAVLPPPTIEPTNPVRDVEPNQNDNTEARRQLAMQVKRDLDALSGASTMVKKFTAETAAPAKSAVPPQQQNAKVNQRQQQRQQRQMARQQSAPSPSLSLPPLKVSELQSLPAQDLLNLAIEQNLVFETALQSKHDIVIALLREHVRRGGSVEGDGYLVINQDGSGFLRSMVASLLPASDDVVVPQSIVSTNALRPGDKVICRTHLTERGGRFDHRFVSDGLISVNGLEPSKARRVMPFKALVVKEPTERLHIRSGKHSLVAATADLLTPMAFGSRLGVTTPDGVSAAPALRQLASSIADASAGSAEVFLALLGTLPETMAAFAKDEGYTLLGSSVEEAYDRHLELLSNLIDIARRKVESGKNVVLVVDIVTLLARIRSRLTGPMASGAFETESSAKVMQKVRSLIGSARAIEGGGSISLVCSFLRHVSGAEFGPCFRDIKMAFQSELALDAELRPLAEMSTSSIAIALLTDEERNAASCVATAGLERAIAMVEPVLPQSVVPTFVAPSI